MKERIKELRKALGLTQQEFADRLGISRGSVATYETRDGSPGDAVVNLICREFNASETWLRTGEGDMLEAKPDGVLDELARQYKLNANARAMVEEFLTLPPDLQDAFMEFAVRAVKRVQDGEPAATLEENLEQAKAQEEAPEEKPETINLYMEPAAAGIPTPVMGRDYEDYTVRPEDPKGAAYAVRLSGDSMEPYFPDGSIVFVNHDPVRDGDVGIFCVDGGTVCKQFHQRGSIVYLFSLNRNRADADVVLPPGGNRALVCQGRVMTRQRFPIPGE